MEELKNVVVENVLILIILEVLYEISEVQTKAGTTLRLNPYYTGSTL